MPRLDLETLKRIGAETMLREMDPDITFEELADNLEGLTDFNEACSQWVRKEGEDQAQADALGTYISELDQRHARILLRVKATRNVLAQAMDATGTKKLELPEATLSMRAGKAKVIVTDESQLPATLWTEKIVRNPDKNAIAAELDTGPVPGATMSNPQPNLTIRRK